MDWRRRRKREEDLDRELRAHLELEAEEQRDSGLSPVEADRAARRAFGNTTLVKEETRAVWGRLTLERLGQDLRYALRTLRKSPAFTAVALLSITLGIAANTTVFSLIDAMWFRTLPVRDAEQLVRVYAWGLPKGANRPGTDSFSWPLYDAVRRRSTVLTDLVAHYSTAPLQVSAGGETGEVQGAVVSANYFPMLGIQPALGRFFLPEEDQVRGRDAVAVISMALWQRRFGGDPAVLGRPITINGVVFRIIGIAPEEFRGIVHGVSPNDLWIPAMMIETGYRRCNGFADDCAPLDVIARLPPGRKLEEARAELSAIIAAVDAAPGYVGPRSAYLDPAIGLEQFRRNRYTNHMRLMASIAALLLILACANVAGLLMARAVARRREIAVRLSIGAGRSRLVRQLLTESLVLAAAGAGLGLLLTLWTRRLLLSFYTTSPEGYVSFYDLRIDSLTLAISFGLAVLTGLLFGLVPAIQATKPDVAFALKGDSVSGCGSGSRVRTGLVMSQIVLSLVMVVSAGLLARSALHIERGGTFDPHGVALLRLRPRLIQYPPARSQAFIREVVPRLEALPGVESVTFASGLGLVWQDCCTAYLPERRTEAMRADYHVVAPRYFVTLRMPLLAGREFDERDRAGSPPVAVVNQTMAARILAIHGGAAAGPGGSVIGRVFVANGKPLQVVGVVRDSNLRSLADAPAPVFYIPFWQRPDETDARMAIRVQGDPQAMLPVLRRAIAEVDPHVPVTEQVTMLNQVRGVFMQARLAAAVLLCASVLALLLSGVGLYGVIAYMVGRRTREIGVRMALGARPASVRALVLRQSLAVVAPGMAIGVAASLAATRLLGSWLYGVRATDFATFVAAAFVLGAVALVASWIPAGRAARIDPLEALRSE
jgi:predicted permease